MSTLSDRPIRDQADPRKAFDNESAPDPEERQTHGGKVNGTRVADPQTPPDDTLQNLQADSKKLSAGSAAANRAFSARLVEVIPSLRAFGRGLCGRSDLADDLAQEALAKAWAARDSYLPNTNFKAWMFTILRNHYYSWCRKQRRVAPWDPDAAERLLVVEQSQSGHLELAELAAGLQTLPAQQREALILVGAGGFAYEDAAEIVGCAVGTVKSRVARGRAALRNYLLATEHTPGESRPTSAQATAAIFEELNRLDPNAS